MKKLLTITLVLATLLLVSCGQNPPAETTGGTTPGETTSASTTSTETTAATTPTETEPTLPPRTDEGGLAYVPNGDGTCKVAGIGTCEKTTLCIPEKSPAGDTVTEIGDEAFWENETLVAVEIPATVKRIGLGAFYRCPFLDSLTFAPGSALTELDVGSFYGIGMADVEIPAGVRVLPEKVFAFSRILSVTFAEGSCLERIEAEAFDRAYSLETVVLPDTVKTIGVCAFRQAQKMKDLRLPAALTEIGENGFESCDALTSITLPAKLGKIGAGAFRYSTGIRTMTFDGTTEAFRAISIGEDWLYTVRIKEIVCTNGTVAR